MDRSDRMKKGFTLDTTFVSSRFLDELEYNKGLKAKIVARTGEAGGILDFLQVKQKIGSTIFSQKLWFKGGFKIAIASVMDGKIDTAINEAYLKKKAIKSTEQDKEPENDQQDHSQEEGEDKGELLPHQVRLTGEAILGHLAPKKLKLGIETTNTRLFFTGSHHPSILASYSFDFYDLTPEVSVDVRTEGFQAELDLGVEDLIPYSHYSKLTSKSTLGCSLVDHSFSFSHYVSLVTNFSDQFLRPKLIVKS